MSDQVTTNSEALRLFFTEDIYLLKQEVLSLPEQVLESEIVVEVETLHQAPADKAIPEVTTTIPKLEDSLKPTPAEEKVMFNYLGKNQRQILILVNDAQNQVSTEQGRELLRKLVKAIELTANDFALLNFANHSSANYTTLNSYFSSKVMFVFGVTPAQLGLGDFPQNSLVHHESTRLIFSSDLHTLDGDPQAKKTLWGSLKQLTF